jgi:hypothetical protein
MVRDTNDDRLWRGLAQARVPGATLEQVKQQFALDAGLKDLVDPASGTTTAKTQHDKNIEALWTLLAPAGGCRRNVGAAASVQDAVYLNLGKGPNELLFVLAESFGGWGLQARLADMDGIGR